MKQAVSYLRVSSLGQVRRAESVEGFSIEAQREACRGKAASLEATVVEEFVDYAESAKTAGRPQLKAMLTRLAARDIDYVIVHKLDRLARSRADDVEIVAAIRAAGAQIVSVTENIDETPTGLLLHGIMASVAEFYSRNLATEILKGTVQKAKNGGTPKLAPLGYHNIRQWHDGREVRTVELDPERAEPVRWAFGAYATGAYTLDTLTEALHDRGLTTRPTRTKPARPLGRSSLARMLADPYYIGIVRYRGVDYEGTHERLVPPDIFARVQAVLSAHGTAGEKDRKHPHYLKGTIYCGHCGRRFLFTHARGNGGTYEYFMCAGRHNDKNGCPQPYLTATDAEAAVAHYYGHTIRLPAQRIAKLRDALTVALEAVVAQRDRHLAPHGRRVEALEAERRKLLQLHYADKLDAELFGEEQARIASELAAAKQQLANAEWQIDELTGTLDEALRLATDSELAYRLADDATRRQWNQAFFTKLFIRDEDIIGAELTDDYAALLADELAAQLKVFAAERAKNPSTDPTALRAWGSIEGLVVVRTGLEPATAWTIAR